MIGGALLWFGWFGFNAGSSLEANGTAALAFANTWLAPAGAALSLDLRRVGDEGDVPPCWGRCPVPWRAWWPSPPPPVSVGVGGALVIGLLSGVAGLWGARSPRLLGADDSLDVFGLHGVRDPGAVLTGVFASPGSGAAPGSGTM